MGVVSDAVKYFGQELLATQLTRKVTKGAIATIQSVYCCVFVKCHSPAVSSDTQLHHTNVALKWCEQSQLSYMYFIS